MAIDVNWAAASADEVKSAVPARRAAAAMRGNKFLAIFDGTFFSRLFRKAKEFMRWKTWVMHSAKFSASNFYSRMKPVQAERTPTGMRHFGTENVLRAPQRHGIDAGGASLMKIKQQRGENARQPQ